MSKISVFFLTVLVFLSPFLPDQAEAESMGRTLGRFETYAIKAMLPWKVPGMAVAVVQGDKVVYAKGFGTVQTGSAAPVTPDTVFQVGSVTKAFTVALTAQLVDQGVIGWNDKVVAHYPDFMMFDPWATRECRIHDLYAQRSGMQNYAGDLQAFMGFDREHMLASLRHIRPVTSFRDTFSYVNNLFLVGAKVSELHTGKTWETLMRERILDPLSMTHSSVSKKGYLDAKDKAVMHIRMKNGALMPIRPGMTVFDWPYVYGPAGGLNSTANDMAKWLTAQMRSGEYEGKRIFSKDSAAFMHTPITPTAKGDMVGAYCQGWLRQHLKRTEIIWHNGNTSGGKSFIGFSPELDTGIVILTNLGGHALPDALGMQFFDMLSGVADADWNAKFMSEEKKETEDTPRPALSGQPDLPAASCEGTYTNPVYGKMTIKADQDMLTVTLGAQQEFTITAKRVAGHVFAGEWKEISPHDPLFEFVFTVDEAGTTTGVTMPDLTDGSGLESFSRRQM